MNRYKRIIIFILMLIMVIKVYGMSEGEEILRLLKRSPKKGLYRLLENRYDADISSKKDEIYKELKRLTRSINFYIKLTASEMLLRYFEEFEKWNSLIVKVWDSFYTDQKWAFVEGSILRMGFKVNELIEKGKLDKKKIHGLYPIYYYGKNFAENAATKDAIKRLELMKKTKNYSSWHSYLSIILAYPDEEIIEFARQEMEWFKSLSVEDMEKLRFSLWAIEQRNDKLMLMFKNYMEEEDINKITPDYFIRYEKEFPTGKTMLRFTVEEKIYDEVRYFCRLFVDHSPEVLKLREMERNKLLTALEEARKVFSNDKNIMHAINYAVDMIKNDKIYGGTGNTSGERPKYMDGWEKPRLKQILK